MKDNKDKVISDLLKRISNLEFDVEDKQREIENLKQINEEHQKLNGELRVENERLNNIINRTTKYVQSLSSKGRGCDIYEDIKQEILQELKGSDSNDN